MLIENTEGIHSSNIQKLIDLYGEEREKEIRDSYQQYRASLESVATIKDHLSFFTYQQTEKILRDKYGKPIIKTKTILLETQESSQEEQPQKQRRTRKRGLLKLLRL